MIILQFRGMKSRYYIITYQAITRLFLDNSESRARNFLSFFTSMSKVHRTYFNKASEVQG